MYKRGEDTNDRMHLCYNFIIEPMEINMKNILIISTILILLTGCASKQVEPNTIDNSKETGYYSKGNAPMRDFLGQVSKSLFITLEVLK